MRYLGLSRLSFLLGFQNVTDSQQFRNAMSRRMHRSGIEVSGLDASSESLGIVSERAPNIFTGLIGYLVATGKPSLE